VLTAAHCLANRRTGRMVQPGSVHFLQGFSRGEYTGHGRVAEIRTGGWDPGTGRPTGSHWAILRLATPLRGPSLPLWQGDLPAGARLMLGGYQQDRAEVIMADTDCAVLGRARDDAGQALIAHGCAATRGASGAPLILALPDGRFAVAGVSSLMELTAGRGFAVPADVLR
jgi:protease YdgD